jgi:hypothetical protein
LGALCAGEKVIAGMNSRKYVSGLVQAPTYFLLCRPSRSNGQERDDHPQGGYKCKLTRIPEKYFTQSQFTICNGPESGIPHPDSLRGQSSTFKTTLLFTQYKDTNWYKVGWGDERMERESGPHFMGYPVGSKECNTKFTRGQPPPRWPLGCPGVCHLRGI